MARLAHEVGELGLVVGPGGEQATAQRVAGIFVRVQPGVGGGLLDEPRVSNFLPCFSWSL
jgi:hypothetical protein